MVVSSGSTKGVPPFTVTVIEPSDPEKQETSWFETKSIINGSGSFMSKDSE